MTVVSSTVYLIPSVARDLARGGRAPAGKVPRCARDEVPLPAPRPALLPAPPREFGHGTQNGLSLLLAQCGIPPPIDTTPAGRVHMSATNQPAVTGLHHVTCIAGDPQRNFDFYTGTLGMRLVKRSVNQDSPGTYHLFYADNEGHAGSDITFFPWPELPPGRRGVGLTNEVGLAIPAGTLGVVGRAAACGRRRDGGAHDVVRRAGAAVHRSRRTQPRAGGDRRPA